MNSYQIAFLMFIALPPIFSIVIDKLSDRVDGVRWIEWSESIFPLYIWEIIIVLLISVYLTLGKL